MRVTVVNRSQKVLGDRSLGTPMGCYLDYVDCRGKTRDWDLRLWKELSTSTVSVCFFVEAV